MTTNPQIDSQIEESLLQQVVDRGLSRASDDDAAADVALFESAQHLIGGAIFGVLQRATLHLPPIAHTQDMAEKAFLSMLVLDSVVLGLGLATRSPEIAAFAVRWAAQFQKFRPLKSTVDTLLLQMITAILEDHSEELDPATAGKIVTLFAEIASGAPDRGED